MTVTDSPPVSKRAQNQFHIRNKDPTQWSDIDKGLQEALEIWRDEEAAARWGPYHMIGGRGILGDQQIERIVPLARRGLIQTVENLKRHVPKWHYHDRYGPQILRIVLDTYPISLDTQKTEPPLAAPVPGATQPSDTPLPKKQRAQVHCGVCGKVGHNSRNVLKCEKQQEKRQDMIKAEASKAALNSLDNAAGSDPLSNLSTPHSIQPLQPLLLSISTQSRTYI
ncbi:hypothetical protein FRC07_002626 [Ceratobasidium sp. 392]|nr:hypothetical protein FRC07_002626 [Ceratobasidium sp. 392]